MTARSRVVYKTAIAAFVALTLGLSVTLMVTLRRLADARDDVRELRVANSTDAPEQRTGQRPPRTARPGPPPPPLPVASGFVVPETSPHVSLQDPPRDVPAPSVVQGRAVLKVVSVGPSGVWIRLHNTGGAELPAGMLVGSVNSRSLVTIPTPVLPSLTTADLVLQLSLGECGDPMRVDVAFRAGSTTATIPVERACPSAAPSVPTPSVPIASPDEQEVGVFSLVVNRVPLGEILALVVGETVYVAEAEAAALQLPIDMSRPSITRNGIALRPLNRAMLEETQVDAAAAQIGLTLSPDAFERTTVSYRGLPKATESGVHLPSLITDYHVTFDRNGDLQWNTSFLANVGRVSGSTDVSHTARGFSVRSSTVWIDSLSRRLRVTAGDQVTGNALGYFRGLSLTRRFDFQPNRPVRPVIDLHDFSRYPSQLEVYSNGALIYAAKLPPGPFSILDLPLLDGRGVLEAVVTDAMGQRTVHRFPFSQSARLLRPGLHDFTYSIGAPFRSNATSPSITNVSVSGEHRVGITSNLTTGLAFALTPQGRMLRATVDTALPFGTFELSPSVFSGPSGRSFGGRLSYNIRFRAGSIVAGVQQNTPDVLTGTTPRVSTAATLGASIRWRTLTTGIDLLAQREAAGQTRLVRWNLGLRKAGLQWLFNAEVGRRASGALQSAIRITASWFARSHSVTAAIGGGAQTGRQSDVTIQRPLSLGDRQLAYTVRTSPTGGVSGTAQLQLPGVRIQAAADAGPSAYASLSASGTAVFTSGRLFFAHPSSGGFALVRTGTVDGIRLSSGIGSAGRTRRTGWYLLKDLIPFYPNRVTINPDDVPLSHWAPTVEGFAAPRGRTAVLLPFPVLPTMSFKAALLMPAAFPAATALEVVEMTNEHGDSWVAVLDTSNHLDAQDVAGTIFRGTVQRGEQWCRFELRVAGNPPWSTVCVVVEKK